jgi:hypothetical protein
MSDVVTVKVPRERKERAGKVARVAKAEQRELKDEMDKVSRSLKGKLSRKDIVKAIRETRDERFFGSVKGVESSQLLRDLAEERKLDESRAKRKYGI